MPKNNVDLTSFNTLKTHVTAQFYTEARTKEELIEAVQHALSHKIPYMILGGGSNIAFVTTPIEGLVIRNLYSDLKILKEDDKSVDVSVSSGYPIGKLVGDSIQKGWSGVELHMGLPGTVGGAVCMNSKWTRPLTYMGDVVVGATLLDNEGNIKNVEREYFRFAYDYSYLQETREALIDVILRLKKDSIDAVKKRAFDALEYRKATQPFGEATSGCFFQNVDGKSSGLMIDQAGLKGMRVGSFVVSDKHANFIINEGKGQPEDLKKLLQTIKDTVKEKFGVDLKEEVKVI